MGFSDKAREAINKFVDLANRETIVRDVSFLLVAVAIVFLFVVYRITRSDS